MKKIIVCFVIIFAAVACKKTTPSNPASTTVNISVDANKTYRYSLGQVKLSDVEVATSPAHASASKIMNVNPGTDSTVYVFVPDTNYTGPDQVVITVPCCGHNCDHTCNHPCNKHHDKGHCNKGQGSSGNQAKYILNFTVAGQANN